MILVAEDDPDDRSLIELALSRAHSPPEVRFVEDGRELLDYLRRRGPWADGERSPTPDLVLLDLNMPRMNGRDALRRLKEDPELRCLPVVVFTTSDDPREIRACYESGANAFVTKPCSIGEFTRALSVLVEFWIGVAKT